MHKRLVLLTLYVCAVCFGAIAESITYTSSTPIETVRRGAKKGDPAAMRLYGIYIVQGKISGSLQDGFKWVEKASKKGDATALYNLGYFYDKGIGTLINKQKAFEYYSAADKAGISWAANQLGNMYYTGTGVYQDYGKAFQAYLKSANAGNVVAYNNVAKCYILGQGVEPDTVKGVEWYEKAADKGMIGPSFFCAMLYYKGESYLFTGVTTTPDYQKAIKYMNYLIESPTTPDDVLAETYKMLSACYRFGRGVESDEAKADEYISKASALGEPDAKKIAEWFNL